MPGLPTSSARERFAGARVARLATVTSDGGPHLVPIVFAVLPSAAGDRIVSAVDHKPKSTRALRRLSNIAAEPRVSLLVDEYDDDWSRLWWVRVDGVATMYADARPAERAHAGPTHAELVEALVAKYEQYRAVPPAGPFIVIEPTRWSGWSAT